jgi:hypothetical protein
MTTFWLIYHPELSRCFRGASIEKAMIDYNWYQDAANLMPRTWEQLAAEGWKLCHVEDYS